jgi:hypothetical protein
MAHKTCTKRCMNTSIIHVSKRSPRLTPLDSVKSTRQSRLHATIGAVPETCKHVLHSADARSASAHTTTRDTGIKKVHLQTSNHHKL